MPRAGDRGTEQLQVKPGGGGRAGVLPRQEVVGERRAAHDVAAAGVDDDLLAEVQSGDALADEPQACGVEGRGVLADHEDVQGVALGRRPLDQVPMPERERVGVQDDPADAPS